MYTTIGTGGFGAGYGAMRARTSMVRMSGTSPVCLVQPNKQDKPNKPIRRDVRLVGVQVDGGARVCERMDQG